MRTDSPTRRQPPIRSLPGVLLGALLAVAAVGAPAPAEAATGYRLDLARPGDFVAQTTFVQCVGASVQMMVNISEPGADRTAATQRRDQVLARSLSGPSPLGRVRQGASVRGWSAALERLGYGPYAVVGEPSLAAAMKTAARAIRMTGRPVGLLVWRGRHAWVMSGFEATADPAVTDAFRVTAASILDPLYPYGSSVWGPSPRPGRAISVAAVGRQFVARSSGREAARWLSASLAGQWVLVLPVNDLRQPWPGRLS